MKKQKSPKFYCADKNCKKQCDGCYIIVLQTRLKNAQEALIARNKSMVG